MIEDLCWVKEGFYFDVVADYRGTWSAYFNGSQIKESFSKREEAQEWLESKTIEELVDILTY